MRQWLFRYTCFTAVFTLFLILAGGAVVSTGSSLAVPDWPLSYGMLFPPMVGGIFYEHGHRMIATFVGMLTIGLAFWMGRADSRRWVRNLGYLALLAVILQGVLGGITVLFLLPTPVSVGHATLAQTFFCMVVALAVFQSRRWRRSTPSEKKTTFPFWALLTTIAIYLQLIFGAVMRHTNSGLAIPDFPLVFGGLLPPTWTFNVGIHYLHRAWAVLIFGLWIILVAKSRKEKQVPKFFQGMSVFGFALVMLQVLLGGWIIWSEKGAIPSTVHVAIGATTLAVSLILTLFSLRELGTQSVRLVKEKTLAFRELTKPGVTTMVVITSALGFIFGAGRDFTLLEFFTTVLATFFVAAGASAFNEWMELDVDRLMKRTMNRPLPSGRLKRNEAFAFASLTTVIGLVLFYILEPLAFYLALGTHLSYVLVYTPIKRITTASTLIGAVPGAMPPVLGWACATGRLGVEALVLFLILFLWQMPHFLAIAVMYRQDYRKANLKVLPVVDHSGNRTRWQLRFYSVLLAFATALPAFFASWSILYLVGGLSVGLLFAYISYEFSQDLTIPNARSVLLASLVYLPSVLVLITVTR